MKKILIMWIIFLLFLFNQVVESAEKDNLKIRINQPVKKCWQRQKAFEDTGNSSLCRDFEKLLNTTCEPPEKLKCKWTLPPGEKIFKKLEWQTLEWKNYWGLIEGISKGGLRKDVGDELWQREEERIRTAFEKGLRKLQLSKAAIDIDHSGKPVQIVREIFTPEGADCGMMFGVLKKDTKHSDKAYDDLFALNASEGAEIMIYKNQAFMFGWDYGWNLVMVWQGFDTLTGKGSLNVCQFKYTKGGIK